MDTAGVPSVSPVSTGIDVTGHSIEELFPDVDPEFVPFGTRVLVVLRRVITETKWGLQLVQDTKDTEAWNIQIGRLVSTGPLAFCKRDSGQPWPEGVWAKPGDFVMVPRWGGERRSIPAKDGKEVVVLLLNDSDLQGKFTGDPRNVKAFIA